MSHNQNSPILTILLSFTTLTLLLHHHPYHQCNAYKTGPIIGRQGQWQLLRNNTGVIAMHMALTHQNTVLIFDQTGAGPSSYRLQHRANGLRCLGTRVNDKEDPSCYAHSVEYHIASNTLRPLRIAADPFCSSGTFLSNGTLLQTGGYATGYKKIRTFHPCGDGKCDWKLSKARLADNRWYASNQLLPSGNDRVIIVGGQRVFSYEFVPKRSTRERFFALPFLQKTYNKSEGGNNLYPFLHLSSDGHLFIFANRDSILFNYRRNQVVKSYPRMPGPGSRSYPGSGSSVILPLEHRDRFERVEVMVCGGAAEGAHSAARSGRFLEALRTCGRMEITGSKNQWEMEEMPGPRLLMDMIILPTGNILIINGAESGTAGWNNAARPATSPLLYRAKKPLGKRFFTLKSTHIPRMYHSSAILLPDGRVLVGGSNPNRRYTYHNVAYPTELRLQAFAPQYTDRAFRRTRPRNVSIEDGDSLNIKYREPFIVTFRLSNNGNGMRPNMMEFNMYAPPFTTHSVAMNQRMLKLGSTKIVRSNKGGLITAMVEAPPSPNVAPPGYYLLFVVHAGIPSIGQWVNLGNGR